MAAVSEFDLRGPFQSAAYGRIMDSTSKMLDSFHAMNLIIQKNPNATAGEASLLKYTADERSQLCARISHLFQVLASSLKLEYPLNDALPDTSNPRDRLLAKIWKYRKSVMVPTKAVETDDEGELEYPEIETRMEDTTEIAKDEDYELIYAYTLVTGQIAAEIKTIEREIEGLFGVVDEDLFELS